MSMELSYQELLSKQEELHQDLVPFLDTKNSKMFPTLRHPLVYSIPYSPAMNALLITSRIFSNMKDLIDFKLYLM